MPVLMAMFLIPFLSLLMIPPIAALLLFPLLMLGFAAWFISG